MIKWMILWFNLGYSFFDLCIMIGGFLCGYFC